MEKLPASSNRRIIGASAILAAIGALTYIAKTANSRNVAGSPQESPAVAQHTTSRHTIGVSAILVSIAVLGYVASTATSRHVASLPQEGPTIAQQAPTESSNQNTLDQLGRVPPNAYGSGRGQSLGEKLKSGVKAVLPSADLKSAQTESKNWSDEDWRIAEEAVAKRWRASKNSMGAGAHSAIVWQPPEEIAGRSRSGLC